MDRFSCASHHGGTLEMDKRFSHEKLDVYQRSPDF